MLVTQEAQVKDCKKSHILLWKDFVTRNDL